MSLIQIQRTHQLGPARAKAVVEHVAQRMREQYHVDIQWENDAVMLFRRAGIDGRIEIEPAVIRVQARLGLLLKPLRSTVEEEIARRLQQYLDDAAEAPSSR